MAAAIPATVVATATVVVAANIVAAAATVAAAHIHDPQKLERIRLRTQAEQTGRNHGGQHTALHRRLLKNQNTWGDGNGNNKPCRRNRRPRVALGTMRQP
jgi:hypothetical protein